jgi:hypothetical protein
MWYLRKNPATYNGVLTCTHSGQTEHLLQHTVILYTSHTNLIAYSYSAISCPYKSVSFLASLLTVMEQGSPHTLSTTLTLPYLYTYIHCHITVV